MGYVVNFNEADYADAATICDAANSSLREVEQTVLRLRDKVLNCQQIVQSQCIAAGLGPRGHTLNELWLKLLSTAPLASEAATEAEKLSQRTRQAMVNYIESERLAQRLITDRRLLDQLADLVVSSSLNDLRPPRQTTEQLVRLVVDMLTGPLWGYLDDSESKRHGDVLRTLSRVLGLDTSRRLFSMKLCDTAPIMSQEIDGGLSGYYQLHDYLERDAQQNPGRFMVVQAEQRGRDVYLVVLPGTQDNSWGQLPFDAKGILDAYGGESQNLQDPVDEALRLSGAGPGDEVILSGYSQGGLHVANLLKNAFLRKKYRLNQAVTFGSPVGTIQLPKQVRSLHLEDAKDMVPGLEGVPNQYQQNQLTVTFDGPRRPDELESGFFGKAHNLHNYGEHLAELERRPTGQVRENVRELSLDGGPVKLRRFQLRRRHEYPAPPLNHQGRRVYPAPQD
ncbi:hypothetical protein GCM10027417_13310 [Glutamicibacter endophyticus]